jgi:SAM-dependent methyltransferase
MAEAKNYFAWQARLVTPWLGRRVVEVGCGTGNFTRSLLDREAVIAIDIESACLERLRSKYPDRSNLHTCVCSPEDPAFLELIRFRPDSCVCMNVLEHIENDLSALRAMAAILPPGAAIVLLVPAFPALYGPIDRNTGHYRRYTRSSLEHLAAQAALEIRSMRYMNLAGFFGWWANARVFRRQAQSAGQIAFFDQYLVPLLSGLEGALAPPFGQSLIAVLGKTANWQESCS